LTAKQIPATSDSRFFNRLACLSALARAGWPALSYRPPIACSRAPRACRGMEEVSRRCSGSAERLPVAAPVACPVPQGGAFFWGAGVCGQARAAKPAMSSTRTRPTTGSGMPRMRRLIRGRRAPALGQSPPDAYEQSLARTARCRWSNRSRAEWDNWFKPSATRCGRRRSARSVRTSHSDTPARQKQVLPGGSLPATTRDGLCALRSDHSGTEIDLFPTTLRLV
jgi:hypothetical protein